MSKGNTSKTEATTALEVVAGGPLAQIKEVIMTIPQAQENPTDRMAAFVLNSPPENWEELWKSLPNLKDNVGRKFRLHDLRVAESDFESDFGVYLIGEVSWLDTGEVGLLTNSSQISMVQWLALYRDKMLPADLEIVQKEKPTKAGFRPIHLRYLDRAKIPAGDPTQVVSEQ